MCCCHWGWGVPELHPSVEGPFPKRLFTKPCSSTDPRWSSKEHLFAFQIQFSVQTAVCITYWEYQVSGIDWDQCGSQSKASSFSQQQNANIPTTFWVAAASSIQAIFVNASPRFSSPAPTRSAATRRPAGLRFVRLWKINIVIFGKKTQKVGYCVSALDHWEVMWGRGAGGGIMLHEISSDASSVKPNLLLGWQPLPLFAHPCIPWCMYGVPGVCLPNHDGCFNVSLWSFNCVMSTFGTALFILAASRLLIHRRFWGFCCSAQKV